jgi:tetratricopeptide (TPR) repeat protein
MKLLSLLFVLFTSISYAQLDLPKPSSDAMLKQNIGQVNFELHYGRPSVRGRKIFGELVPYNKLWRTGANKTTTLYFDKDVKIAGAQLHAGIYSLATIPGEKEWTVMFNSDTSKIYGEPSEYDAKNEVLQFKVKPIKSLRFTETLLIDLEEKRNDAVFVLSWENTEIRFVIETGAHQRALASIERELQKTPDDPEVKLSAAWYHLMTNENYEKALQWTNESLAKEETWWGYEMKINTLQKLKRNDEAKKAAAAGIDFLKRKKPDDWQKGVSEFELKQKTLSSSK